MRRVRQTQILVTLVIGALVLMPVHALAQNSSSSTNYRVDETFFGSGGELENSSTNYKAKTTVGELGVGSTASASYLAYAGFNTTDAPYLEFIVTGDNIDLGYLDTASVKTATGTFKIRAWQASGYTILTASDPPANIQNPAQTIDPLTGGGASTPGTEQFGINLVDNATPNIGVNPVQLPDNTFSFGQAATNYATANNFRYNKGDVIALSNRSTSITEYTISYIFNISNVTPSGEYRFNHILVALGTY